MEAGNKTDAPGSTVMKMGVSDHGRIMTATPQNVRTRVKGAGGLSMTDVILVDGTTHRMHRLLYEM